MSFAGFGAALGDLFTGMSQADKEREKVRRAQLMQDAQIGDIGSQGRERDAMATQRLAQAKRDEQLASPEFAAHLTRAITDGNVDDIAWITQRRPEFLSTLSRNPPAPKSLQSAEFLYNGKPVKGYYDPAVGGYFYNGVRVPNPGVIPPSSQANDSTNAYRQWEIANKLAEDAQKNIPQPGKAFPAGIGADKRQVVPKFMTPNQRALAGALGMTIPADTAGFISMQNPNYVKALVDSAAYANSSGFQQAMQTRQQVANRFLPSNLVAGVPPQTPPAATPAPVTQPPIARPVPSVPQSNVQAQAQHSDKDPGFVDLVNSLRGKPYDDIVRAVTKAGYDVNTGQRRR